MYWIGLGRKWLGDLGLWFMFILGLADLLNESIIIESIISNREINCTVFNSFNVKTLAVGFRFQLPLPQGEGWGEGETVDCFFNIQLIFHLGKYWFNSK